MRSIVLLAAAAAFSMGLMAEVKYQKPPKEILDVLHAPASPFTSISPTKTHILLMERRLYPGIDELSAPVHRIAGLRINPANNGPHAPAMVFTGMKLLEIATGKQTAIATPPGAKLGMPEWSPDGKRFAITNTTATGVELCLGSIQSTFLRRVPGVRLNDTIGDAFGWLAGSKELLVRITPAGRGTAPKPPAAPSGPNVQESSGRSGPVRTYQDMLASPHDELLFDYYCTSQLATVDFVTAKATPVGKPALLANADASPDGKYFLVGGGAAAVLVRTQLPIVPARDGGLGPQREAGVHGAKAWTAGRSADRGGADGSAQCLVAAE